MAQAIACAYPPIHNWYLFSVVRPNDYQERTHAAMLTFWKEYTGDEDFYFFADEVMAVAQRKGDKLMLSYVSHLQKYLQQAQEVKTESWDYPTKEALKAQRETLEDVRRYALTQLSSRLGSQHALLVMRCNMLLGLHEANILFWEQQCHGLQSSVYRDMMRNIYAGALLKCGRMDEATSIFMEQGDISSLYTYFYDKRKVEDIARVYALDPDAPSLTFLLQDFANNAQEAIDGLQGCEWPGKLFINNIEKEECEAMCALARRVVSEGKSSQPALWKSLEAWLQYLFGDPEDAVESIRQAVEMKGNARIQENARVLRLYLMAEAGEATDDFMAKELTWLEARIQANPHNSHYSNVLDRLVHLVLVKKYSKEERPAVAAYLLDVCDKENLKSLGIDIFADETAWNSLYSSDFFNHINTLPVSDVEALLAFKPQTALERWLDKRRSHDDIALHELLGTQYIRHRQWQRAIQHLRQVPMTFIASMNIAPFMAQRSYTVEPWIKRQWLKYYQTIPGDTVPGEHQKLLFATEMQQLEHDYHDASGEERLQLAFQLAVRYYQASEYGDAWYLTCYGKSTSIENDAIDPPFVQEAHQLLDEASKSSDFSLRERALYARAFAPYDNWHDYQWSNAIHDMIKIPIKSKPEYKAMKRLAEFAKEHHDEVSPYISRCDILKQFMRQN